MIRVHSSNRFALAALGCAIAALSAATQVPGSVLPVLSHSQVTGIPPAGKMLYFTVSLKPRFGPELQAFCDAVSDPRSDSYRHWLTPAQVGQQFGASPSTVSMVINYLRSKGIVITLQSPNNMAILARGTVAQVQAAFGTVIKDYRGPDIRGNTITFEANSTPLNVPSTWISNLQAVSGIQNWTRPYPAGQTQTLTPPLTQALYNTKPAFLLGFRGEGRTVGISNWDGFNLSNVPLFVNAFGLPFPSGGPGSNVRVVTIGSGSQNGAAQGEGDLDIQMELGLAPMATILVYDDGPPDPIATVTKEASDNLADVISESWGWGLDSGTAVADHNQHLAMTAQGQTYMCASGDSGTNWPQQLPWPDADPEIMDVGGTIATVYSNSGARISEVVWNGSGGGWTNSGYPFDRRPSWQQGNGVPNQPNFRLVPDIGLQSGGPGAFVIYFNGQQVAFDGTSCASPTNAAGFAIIEQRLAALNIPPRLGRVNDLIYAQNGQTGGWFDITQGSNGTLPDGTTSNARPGWDFCCGWGAPDYDALYNSLVQVTTATPYFPVGVSTDLGSYIIGDPSSLTTSDGIYYQIGSVGISQFGQAGAAGVTFTIPQNAVAIDIDLQGNSGGEVGGTNMVWLLNQFTGNYDLIGAVPMNAAGSTDQVIKVRSSDVPLYIGSGGEVDMIIRGHVPIRPFNNQMPVPFTYRLDLLELLVR